MASPRSHTCVGAVLASSVLASLPAQAVELNTGNPDVDARWENTVRYNLGTRLQGRDPFIDRASGFAFDQSNALFDKGDLITNRLDLLSELNVRFKGRYGARLSAAAWYDAAYGSHAAHTDNPSAYLNDEFTSDVKRYYHGPSGEFLDAYVYGRLDLGSVPLDARLGRHAVIWGEGLFGSTNSIAYSQGPSDSRKAAANPGASAKETALPTNQVSASAQVTDQLTLAAHYSFEWKPNRLPEGGTYYAPADIVFDGPNNANREGPVKGKGGDVGLALRWQPNWMDGGTLGLYYRKFDEKQPWPLQFDAATGKLRSSYAKDVQLVGLSVTKVVGGISVGSDVSYRWKMPLNSRGNTQDTFEGARGKTFHAVLNGVKTWSSTALFDSAALAAEVGYSRLVKVTDNAQFYRGEGNPAVGCATLDTVAGCSSKSFWTAGVSFTPTWQQVFPGVDVSLPLFYSRNLKGNAPTNTGGNEGFQVLKVGVSALAYSKHTFDLAATFFHGQTDKTRGLVNGAPYNDKANLVFTYQTSF